MGLTTQAVSSAGGEIMNFASVAAAGIVSSAANSQITLVSSATATTIASGRLEDTITSKPLTGFPTISESLALCDNTNSTTCVITPHLVTMTASPTSSLPTTLGNLPATTNVNNYYSSTSQVIDAISSSELTSSATTTPINSCRAFSRAPGSERHRTPERDRGKDSKTI